jgi:integrase
MPKAINWTGYDQTCIEFLTSQKSGTRQTYKAYLRLVLEFTGMTGLQILESKKKDTTYYWEKKVIEFKQWMKERTYKEGTKYSDNAVNTAITALRSFFDYYRTPLLLSQSEKRKLNGKARRTTADYMLTNDDVSKMAFVGDLREKYIVLLGKSIGLRAGDFIGITYGMFRSINLEQEPPIFLGELQTQKEGVTAYPFIDADALPTVRAIVDANRNNDERVITVQEEELSTTIQRLAKKANINLGDKHLRFHCFRKYLIDRLATYTASESKWKQIVGKSISEDAYVTSFQLREIYREIMKFTTINTNGTGKISALVKQMDEVNKQVRQIETHEYEIQSLKSGMIQVQELKQEIENRERLYKERLEKIESKLFPKTIIIEDPIVEAKKIREWNREHPKEAKEQEEQDKEWEKEYWERFQFFKNYMKENPDQLITYITGIDEELEYIKHILKKSENQNSQDSQKKEG